MKLLRHILKTISKLLVKVVSFPSKLLPSRWLRKLNRDQRRVFNLTVTGIVVVVGTWTASSLLAPDRSEASWFDDSWLYRQVVTATNDSPFTADNVPYRILIDTATPIAAGKMKSDGSDIRVVNNQGKVVRFQVEQSTLNSSETGIWFDADIQADNSATYYVYYGNSSATTPSFSSDVESSDSNGTTVTMKDGYGYTTSTSYGRTSDILKDGTSLNVAGTYRNTGSYPGTWWDDRAFTRSQLASGPLFVEVKFEDTDYGHYSSYGSIIKMFDNGFVEEHVYMNYNNTGSEELYYYQRFTEGTRNAVWVDASETLIDQAANTGTLFRADLGHNWFGQRWTDTGDFGGTIISPKTADWEHGYTANTSYYQTNYSTTESYATGSARLIRVGLFAGNGTVNEMHEKGSIYGAQSTTLSAEESGPGPIAYWKFDEGSGSTVNDSTNTGNNGTISGATWQEKSQCISDKCLYFDGTDDEINLSKVPTLPSGAFTLSAWVKPTQSNTTGFIFWQGESQIWYSGNAFHVRLFNDSTSFVVSSESNKVPNQWYYVSFIYTGSEVQLYVNGQAEGTWISASGNARSYGARFGRDELTTTWFKGYIDEPILYPYARTQEQIYTDYNSGAAAVLGAKDSNLNNGLVGYWKMDDNVSGDTQTITDASGTGNTGTTDNGANTTGMDCTRQGKFGGSCNFDGVDDYIDLGNDSSIAGFSTNFSAGAWIKATNAGGVIHRGGFSGSTWQHLLQIESGSQLRVRLWQAGTGTGTSFTLTDLNLYNTWNHIFYTYDGAVVRVYINGELESSTAYTSSIATGDTTWLGQYPSGGTRYFTGQMDEVRIYKRALTPAEVQQLYNFAPPPVAYYDFEEGSGITANDKSGNGNTGTMGGTGTHWTSGKYGKGGYFNGTDDYVDIGNTASTTLNGHITLEAWINPADESTSRAIIRKDSNYILYYFGGNLDFYLYGPNFRLSYPLSNLDTNRWYHVAATYDGQYMKMYIDGTEVASSAQTTALTSSSSSLRIGSSSTGSYFWDGKIDEVRIYNYARTPAQIIEDMNAGHPIGGSPVGSQIGYWKFDEGSGTTANDTSQTKNNGTITDATWTDGKFGKALSFNGTSSFVSASGYSEITNQGSYSFSTWIYPTGDGTIFQRANGCNDRNGMRLSGTALSFGYYDGTGWTAVYGNVTLNQWNHIVGVNTNGAHSIYINGKAHTTATSSTYIHCSGTDLYIGKNTLTGSENFFNGKIDEVKIYNDALTQEQVLIDMNQNQSLQFGVLGTDASGNPSNSSDRAYCPPGDTTASCGPVAEWKFDERTGTTAKDTSGGGISGTLTNSPTWTTGKIGSALDFNGTNQQVTMGDNLDLIGSPISISVWVKPRTWVSLGGIVTKLASGGNYRLIMQSNGTVAFGIRASDNTYQQVASTTTLPLNQWSHITVAYDNSSTAKIYINGKLDATDSTLTLTRGDAATALVVGYNANNAQYFDGAIDHVQIYNYVRNEAQVAWDYSRGAPIAHYKLNECQGGTVHSSTLPYNSALDGTITIGATGTQTSIGTCQNSGTAWGNGASGKINSSLYFDGTDDYFEISQPQIQTSPNLFTVSGWIKPTNQGSFIIAPDSVGRDQAIRYDNTNQRIFAWVAESIDTNIRSLYSTTGSVPHNTWTHFAISINDKNVKIYINGKLNSEYNESIDIAGWSSNWYIGQRGNNTFQYQGQMDDLQIFNYELTANQVRTVMNQGAIKFGP